MTLLIHGRLEGLRQANLKHFFSRQCNKNKSLPTNRLNLVIFWGSSYAKQFTKGCLMKKIYHEKYQNIALKNILKYTNILVNIVSYYL